MSARTRQSLRLGMLLPLLLSLPWLGCAHGDAKGPRDSGCECEVIFSLANTDRSSPFVKVDVQLDGRPVIHGALPRVSSGDYFYVSMCVPKEHATLVVKMESEGEPLEERHEMNIENKMWIVITRVRDLEDGASMKIDISYEELPWPTMP